MTSGMNMFNLVERAAARLRTKMPPHGGETWPSPASPSSYAAYERERTEPRNGLAARDDASRALGAKSPNTTSPKLLFDHQRLKQAGILRSHVERNRAMEELRIIKRQLINSAFPEGQNSAERANVIMVTSSRPQEGKTFFSLSLAMSITNDPNHHVLLVDVDSPQRGVSRFIAASDGVGVLDVMADPAIDLSAAISRTDIPNLSVMLAGAGRQHGPELLASRRTRLLIEEMANRYEDRIILIDAPPCLVSSDPAMLASIVDQIVFVVEADRTQREEVEASLRFLHACPRISLVLNKTRIAMSDSFGPYAYR